MGNFRCTFRNCKNSTSSRPGMHFFQFQSREWDRLEVWAANAQKLDFKDLPPSKLKNTVVCQEHFENSMLMNYLKTAIPTLKILDNGRVWNFKKNALTDREEWIVRDMNSTDADAGSAPTKSQTTRMEIQFLGPDQEEFTITLDCETQPEVRPPMPVPGKLSVTEKPKNIAPMTPPSEAVLRKVLRKVIIKRKNPSVNKSPHSSKLQVISIQRIQASTGIEELKKILTDVLNKSPPEPQIITIPVPAPAPQAEPSGNRSPKAEKGRHMNKVQLFNGIKRYLNPTMVAMLRMELFAGSADRLWKADEKTVAVDIDNLGENVYDHFCDEFRFRLPSKKDVQKWKEDAMDDDGDAL